MLSVNNFQTYNLKSRSLTFKNYDGYYYSRSSSKVKRFAVGVASFAVPGLGQVINGETSKGLAFFLGSLCNYLLCFKNRNHMTLGWLTRLGIGGWAAHDAYKHS